MEIDYPTKNMDHKLPILDLKVWIEKRENGKLIVYEHYRKEEASKATVFAKSATPTKQKRTILSQEVLRILTHCSPNLPNNVRCKHINNLMKRMQFSGYTKDFRYDAYNSGMKAYNTLTEKEQKGERPINRPKTWKKDERKKERGDKKLNWYKTNGHESVIFVPCTPESQLRKLYEREVKKSDFKIKIVERSGTKIKDLLHKKNPFKKEKCERNDCFVCSTGGKGNCNKENITYDIICQGECERKKCFQRRERLQWIHKRKRTFRQAVRWRHPISLTATPPRPTWRRRGTISYEHHWILP